MIRLEDILPGDIITHDLAGKGIVLDIDQLPYQAKYIPSHLLGGDVVWAIWVRSGERLFTSVGHITSHQTIRKEYDPSQQPYTEDDI